MYFAWVYPTLSWSSANTDTEVSTPFSWVWPGMDTVTMSPVVKRWGAAKRKVNSPFRYIMSCMCCKTGAFVTICRVEDSMNGPASACSLMSIVFMPAPEYVNARSRALPGLQNGFTLFLSSVMVAFGPSLVCGIATFSSDTSASTYEYSALPPA